MNNYNVFELLKKDYLDVYERAYLEDRCEFLFAVWRDLILPNSDKKLMQIGKEKYLIIIDAIEEFKLSKKMDISIGTLDKPIVLTILKMVVKLKKKSMLDFIYKRTKSAAKSMPIYFYHKEIIETYLELLEIDKVNEILKYMESMEHVSYWYSILKYDINKYNDYPEVKKNLRELQNKSIAKLIKNGETINLELDLPTLMAINQYI